MAADSMLAAALVTVATLCALGAILCGVIVMLRSLHDD